MGDRKQDKLLSIKTTGLREWNDSSFGYNRYEATPYSALDNFFEEYKLRRDDQVVDFGCGRGRVAFYIHNRFHVPVTGVEVNEKTYQEALDNKTKYRLRAKHIKAPIRFEYGLAEHYEIDPLDNIFYFFNPFSLQIFKMVVRNIIQSVKEEKRSVDIILYYPLPKFKQFLKTNTPFELINKIRLPGKKDETEKFLVYRLEPDAIEEPKDSQEAC